MQEMSKIKILYLVEDFKIGGLERVVETIYKGIDRTKYDTHLWCLAKGGQLANKFISNREKIKILNLNGYHNLINILKLRQLIKKHKFKIVHTHGYFSNTFGRIAAYLANTPVLIAHVHTTELNLKRRHKFIEKLLSRVTDRVICCSDAVRKFHIEHKQTDPIKTITIYNGINSPHKKKYLRNFNKINIVCVASLVWNKGHCYLLEAIKELCSSGITNVFLYVVGEGPLKNELIKQTRKHGIANKVHFVGIKENIKHIIKIADICVLPTTEREGLGISLIEAMSYGKPVVGTKIGGIPEVIEDGCTGFLVQPKSSISIEKKLKKLILDENLRQIMGQNGKNRFERLFKAEQMINNIEMIYSTVLREKKIDNNNILYLHNKTKISGGEQSLLNLWKNLDKDYFIPHLIIPNDGPLEEQAKKLGLKVDFITVPRLRPKYVFKLFVAFMKLAKYCRENKIKIIHSYTPRNNILSGLVGRLLGIGVIWHERNLIFGSEMDISKYFNILSDCIICNSKAIANRFYKKSGIPSKVRIIKNGVDTQKFSPRPATKESRKEFQFNGKKIVGLVSNLDHRKMPEYFIEACPYILKEEPNTQFLVVGGEFDENDLGRLNELKKMALSKGVDEKILFTGYREDVAEVIKYFDVGVSVTEKEACSRAILELMASGKPVVAFDTGGNSELIEHNVTGWLVEFGDIPGLAKGISDLLKDKNRKEIMGKTAREIATTKFDIKINTRQTENIYSELLKV
jgi:glycosyltransferase involved in cell wall biosynthesis